MKSDLNKKKSILNFNADEWSVDRPVARPFKPKPPVAKPQPFKPIPVNVPPVARQTSSIPSVNTASAIPPQSNTIKKPKKKKWLVVLVILIIIIAAGAMYSNMCEDCHSTFGIRRDNGMLLCDDCNDAYTLDCGHYKGVVSNTCLDSNGNSIEVCSDCYKTKVCDACNTYFKYEDLTDNGVKRFCSECVAVCYHCGEAIRYSDESKKDYLDRYFHEDCYDEYYNYY